MAATAQSSRQYGGEIEGVHARGFGPLVVSLAEYRRAAAAERRYDELTRSGALRPAAVSRQVFEEFYAS